MKKCPHCNKDTFSAYQLLILDYFQADECSKCKNLVRNDGLRQFLVLPAIFAVLLISFALFSFVPEVLEPFALILIFFLIMTPVILLAKPIKYEPEGTLPPFPPDLENDKEITVSGWTEPELRQILSGFIAENNSGWPLNKFELHKELENSFRLTFPKDIHPFVFASLINYALYPIEFGVTDRKIIAVGKTTLNGTFEGIPQGLLGQKAILYVPENDEDHDVVYLQSETGVSFKNSLGENRWRQIDDARLPLEVKRLSLSGVRE